MNRQTEAKGWRSGMWSRQRVTRMVSLALLGGERSGSSVVRERPAAAAREDAGTRTGDTPTSPATPAPAGTPTAPATPAPAPAK